MYLYRKTNYGGQYRGKDGHLGEHTLELNGDFVSDNNIKVERLSSITEEVAYWRKANHIHQWFVDNAQGGVDDCGEYYVSKKQLHELLDLVELVLRTEKTGSDITAETQLPTQEGFFFGSNDYSEWYYEDLRATKEILENLLDEACPDGEYYYSSSW